MPFSNRSEQPISIELHTCHAHTYTRPTEFNFKYRSIDSVEKFFWAHLSLFSVSVCVCVLGEITNLIHHTTDLLPLNCL